MFKSSILSNATSMILIHNHPSGNLEPSKWDTMLTDRMLKLGELIGIPVVDHIIVGGENKECFSFKRKVFWSLNIIVLKQIIESLMQKDLQLQKMK
ncbi:MAG: JAB domain-containing protein [Mediterraneibacter gnavus]